MSSLIKENKRRGRPPKYDPTSTHKTCTECGKTKERKDFSVNLKSSDGLTSWCKECVRAGSQRGRIKRALEEPRSKRSVLYARLESRGWPKDPREPTMAKHPSRYPQWLNAVPRDREVVMSFGSVEKILTPDQAVSFAFKLVQAARACDVARGMGLERLFKESMTLTEEEPSIEPQET